MTLQAVLIPGDGIGPEVSAAVCRIFAAAKLDIQWLRHDAGLAAVEAGSKTTLPESTLNAIRQHHVALKGPCTTPIGTGFSSVNVALRKTLGLYGAVRPIRSLAGVPTRFQDVDLVVIRENTEGLYAGIENEITPGVVTSLKVATELASRRIAEFAFTYAADRGRKKVSVFHKANIMKMSDGLFIRCAKEVSQKWAGKIQYEELIIDAACMRLVQDPSRFDVILMENLYGDIVSDLAAGLIGGLGVAPGANFGGEDAVFEAVHGSAPDIAGKGIANPMSLLMSGVMMLNHLAVKRHLPELKAAADRIRNAYDKALQEGCKTADIGGKLSTEQFVDAVIARLA
ncbi:MAG: isocitrate/isopropylmalate dehydrogenase family protein [Planctomycetes bacterium]|nr:isocitrate/isopropylmalate dehydrogenase family protein [Planctomycetota bacterium]